ncbi:MAG: hypothetical protein KGH71_05880, partial [Candidatus Micrarchaeota archaeon]|nr:hypothetical protein [Candidatus Micrarchaeota archaeon]
SKQRKRKSERKSKQTLKIAKRVEREAGADSGVNTSELLKQMQTHVKEEGGAAKAMGVMSTTTSIE